jgi:hypothetical protein
VASNTAFTFATPVAGGAAYAVKVATQPQGQTCAVTNGSGTVGGTVTTVAVTCSDNTYNVVAVVSGLVGGASVVLQDNGGDNLSVSTNSATNFNTAIASGSTYAVTVLTQPTGETCSTTGDSGTIVASNVSAPVVCVANGYSVGGTVAGLTGTLVLQDNGGDALTLTTNGVFTFNTPLASGSTYTATVSTPPAGQACTITNASGTITAAAVTSIAVNCTSTVAGAASFIWEGGPNASAGAGVYGTKGVASAANLPPSHIGSMTWTDAAGNFWLFGGSASITPGDLSHYLNDLWKYSPATQQWTWVSGSSGVQTLGVYGTQGVAAAGNMPGSRTTGASWVDANGNFWLFGGAAGCDASVCQIGYLNDLWMYSPSSGLWTWVGGSQGFNASGVYGTRGQPGTANVPGGRIPKGFWSDLSGNLWLLGGFAYDANGIAGDLNDLWKFSPGTQQWTWVGGTNSVLGAIDAVRGTNGVAAAGNWPGTGLLSASATDAAGNFWMFGGTEKIAGISSYSPTNDVWEYAPGSGLWTCWTSGTGLPSQPGNYGTQGVAAASSFPASRTSSAAWTDAAGTLWIYGGEGTESATQGFGDLWAFSPSAGLWTWIGGSNSPSNPSPVWGTLGTAGAGNFPGSRVYEAAWKDGAGNFWLFGGGNNDGSASVNVVYDDLWKITP